MFIVDVSRSMLAKDVPPSRMALTKRKMEDIIDAFTASRVPQRYGITLFAGGSYVLCPSTSDIPVLKQFIDNISPEIVTSLGSQLTLGLKTAIERLVPANSPQSPARGKRMILISDGEDDQLAVESAVQMVGAARVRLDVLGVGTPNGATIQLPRGELLKDDSGNIVQSKLHESSLEALAAAGGGVYVRATLTDSDVERIATRLTALPSAAPDAKTREIVTYRELGPLLCGVALVLLALLIVRRRSFLLTLAASLIFSSGHLKAETPPASATPQLPLSAYPGRDGYELYRDGKYSDAVRAFENALLSEPNNPKLRQGLASSLFKSGRYDEALSQFRAITGQSKDGKEYFENAYNEGNTLVALGRYREAIDAFHRALDIKGDDQRAITNLQIARALLEEERKRPTPTPTPTPTPAPPNTSPQPTPSPAPTQAQTPTVEPSPGVGGTPSATPSSADGAPKTQSNASASPSAQPSPSPGDQKHSATPQPTPVQTAPAQASPAGAPQPDKPQENPERLKESKLEDPVDGAQPTPAATSDAATMQKTPAPIGSPLAMNEAEAWLESLPESPLIITKERGRRAPTGQTW
jgi:Ca-activated chloride channel family protein